ncbi:MAG: flavin reductase family protein [Trueperaceae bacterium]|nr:flavin reductase family protein [Trueperaceae bacterium]
MANPDVRSVDPGTLPGRDAYKLLTTLVIPRPIAWVSTVSADGVPNLAPYSFANLVAGEPPVVMFSSSPHRDKDDKDSLKNARDTGEFVYNIADVTLADAMNSSSGDWEHGVDEFAQTGLSAASSVVVTPPRVAAAPAALECKVTQIIPVEGSASTMVLGRVVMVHVRADLFADDGLVDAGRYNPVARLGRDEYAALGEVFSLARPVVKP